MRIFLFLIWGLLFSCAQNDSTPAGANSTLNADFENMPEVDLRSEIDLFSESDQVTLLVIRNIRYERRNGTDVELFDFYSKHPDGTQFRSLSCYFVDKNKELPPTFQKGERFVFQSGELTPDMGSSYFQTSIKTLFYDLKQSQPISVNLECGASFVNKRNAIEKYMTFKELLLGIGDFMQIIRKK